MKTRALPLVAVFGLLSACSIALCACASPAVGPQPHPTKPVLDTPFESATVEPVLVVASVDVDGKHVTASGYVQGVIEECGTCVYTFTRNGSPTITVEREAVADRATTSCGTVHPDAAEFARGSWSVALGYAVHGHDYRSTPVELEIP
ncbi:hypothetical protein O159_05170 [Leifsonia xyli subsp. cynodontis DSM 46306]|jgi:hypothetical protein|uniref:Lipoprotein n=1 Tax=Leifsonia xyli subsp. cynodontis DSM 46306 TaxID=1389489 RepID=U3P708_LEIXC|nr:hypothetical protein [Leifsonia xyli]AGW40712.1 hypothetical protein O159_05170 [Leifsonia xyli subsp. cynodontis DSM 46306]